MTTKILVVDDERLVSRLFTIYFRDNIKAREYEFIFVHNGKEALEKLQTESDFALLLTDLNMPEMDGLTLLSKITELGISIKTVVLSAYSNTDNITKALELGAFDFLTKPINFDDLKTIINRSLK